MIEFPKPSLKEFTFNNEIKNYLLCEQELLKFQELEAEHGCSWGYYRGVCRDEGYPQSVLLAKQLERAQGVEDYRFNFLSVSSRRVTASFGGMHLDTGDDLKKNEELIRIVLNLSSQYQRKIRFSMHNRIKLSQYGKKISKLHYEHLSFLEKEPQFCLEIPPRKKNKLFGAYFFSSVWPHVGSTGDEGHFIAAFDQRTFV